MSLTIIICALFNMIKLCRLGISNKRDPSDMSNLIWHVPIT